MCLAVTVEPHGKRVFFFQSSAGLPVLQRDGAISYVAWGRRQGEPGVLPLEPILPLYVLHSGQCDEFFPRPVKVMATAFMQRDVLDAKQWYPLLPGQYLQGALLSNYSAAGECCERRVYVVSAGQGAHCHGQLWPRVMTRLG